jgi:general secretion pathway protein I
MRPLERTAFTLLEVMIAMAILSISLLTLMDYAGNTLLTSGRAENMTVATMLARQKMTELEIELTQAMQRNEFPDEKDEEGKFDEPYEDYSWKLEIRKVELPAPVTGEKGSIQDMIGQNLTKQIAQTVRELKLTVAWGEGEDESFDIVTHIVKL